LWCTPLYYQDALHRWPKRHAEVVLAFAQAQPGGVLIHCSRGQDRTGIISLLLLNLIGVAAEDIIADYELSPDPERDEILSARGTSSGEVIRNTLDKLDAESYLLEAGLSSAAITSTRERLLE
jgi:protein tyrosine/serine phosphatase